MSGTGFCSIANQGLQGGLRKMPGYTGYISRLERVGLLGKEDDFTNSKRFGEFLSQMKIKMVRNPESFKDEQREVFDRIQKELLGGGSILNLKSTSI